MILWIYMQSRKIKWEKTCDIYLYDPSLYSLVWCYPGVSIPIKWHNSMLLCDWLKLRCVCPPRLKKFNRTMSLGLYCDNPFSKSCFSHLWPPLYWMFSFATYFYPHGTGLTDTLTMPCCFHGCQDQHTSSVSLHQALPLPVLLLYSL